MLGTEHIITIGISLLGRHKKGKKQRSKPRFCGIVCFLIIFLLFFNINWDFVNIINVHITFHKFFLCPFGCCPCFWLTYTKYRHNFTWE